MLTSLENFSRVREKYFSTLVNENCRLSIDHDDGDDQSDKAIVRRPRRAISVNTHTDCSDWPLTHPPNRIAMCWIAAAFHAKQTERMGRE